MRDVSGLEVCIVAGTLGQGGAERQLMYLVTALRAGGASPRVLCLTHGEVWESRIRAQGVPVTWVGQRASRMARLLRIVRVLRRQPPDILQSQHFYTNLYVAAAARMLGIREIGTLRNDAVSEVRANGPVLGQLSLRVPRLIAANSQTGIRNARAMGVRSERLRFLPNVVDTTRFTPFPGHDDGPIRILTIGRLVMQKRIDRFLRIVAHVYHHSSLPVKAIIAGTGPLRHHLFSTAQQLGLPPEAVEFRGDVSDSAALYRNADIFLLTSDWEGTPNVVLEAMASGLPVVATRAGDVPELVSDGWNGYVVDPGDEARAIQHVSRLAHDAQLRREMGARARAAVQATHAADRLTAILGELYEVALS